MVAEIQPLGYLPKIGFFLGISDNLQIPVFDQSIDLQDSNSATNTMCHRLSG